MYNLNCTITLLLRYTSKEEAKKLPFIASRVKEN